MLKKLLLCIFLVFGLSGCAFGPKYNTLDVKETKVEKIKIDSELTTPCIPNRPMVKEEYLKLLPFDKETYLTNYSIELLGTVKDCNIKLKKIKDFSDAQ